MKFILISGMCKYKLKGIKSINLFANSVGVCVYTFNNRFFGSLLLVTLCTCANNITYTHMQKMKICIAEFIITIRTNENFYSNIYLN